MRETKFNVSKSKGELNMKRTIVILALVTAFVLAFTAVAQATWRGYSPVRTVQQLAPLANQVPVDCAAVGCTNTAPCAVDHFIALPDANAFGPDGLPIGGLSNGFISFPEARLEMARNLAAGTGNFRVGGAYAAFGHRANLAAGLQGTAHGGYVTTTTKCIVCHSAHRATGVEDPNAIGSIGNPGDEHDRNRNQAFLTAGANTCIECHVIWGSQPSRLLVEWGGPWSGYTSGGPHAAPRRGCMMCHNSGIHGLANSSFNVMNVFMLGRTRNVVDITTGIPTGTPNIAMNRDQQIEAEMHLWAGVEDSRGNEVMALPPGPVSSWANLPRVNGTSWWAIGDRSIGPVGGLPPGVNGVQFGAARSMATAYTCSEAGCHTTGAFFTLNWGVPFTRADSIRRIAGVEEPDGAIPTPAQNNAMRRIGDVEVTGHVMPSARATGGNNQACGPCHAGNPAGFPTASTTAGGRDNSRRAYGCDQCHDMVGVATNSTAWPHGNRNIIVYEWTAAGEQLDATHTLNANGVRVPGMNVAAAGNLWMYAGNIARAATLDGEGNRIGQVGANNPGAAHQAFRGQMSTNPGFADQSWFVMTNVGAGRYGVPANPADTNVANRGTGLVDGSCLKCHVAIDQGSMDALGSVAACALRHAWNARANTVVNGNNVNPDWTGNPVDGSSRLFLYR